MKSSANTNSGVVRTSLHSGDTPPYPQGAIPNSTKDARCRQPQPAGEGSGPRAVHDWQRPPSHPRPRRASHPNERPPQYQYPVAHTPQQPSLPLRSILKPFGDRQLNRHPSPGRPPVHHGPHQQSGDTRMALPRGGVASATKAAYARTHHPSLSSHQRDPHLREVGSTGGDQPSWPSRERPQLPALAADTGGEVFLTPDELGHSRRQPTMHRAYATPEEFQGAGIRGQYHMMQRPMSGSRKSSQTSRSSRRTFFEFGDDFSAVASELTWEDGMSVAVRSLKSRDDQSHSTQQQSLSTQQQSLSTQQLSLAPPSLKTGTSSGQSIRDERLFGNTFLEKDDHPHLSTVQVTWDVRSGAQSYSTQTPSLAPPSLDSGMSEGHTPGGGKRSEITVSDNHHIQIVAAAPIPPHSTQHQSFAPSRSEGDAQRDGILVDGNLTEKDEIPFVTDAIRRAGEDFEAVKLAGPQIPFFLVWCPLALAIGLGVCFGVLTRMSTKDDASSGSTLSPTSLPHCDGLLSLELESLHTINQYCECFNEASPLPDHFNYGRYERLKSYFEREVSFENMSKTSCEPENRVLLSMNSQQNFTAGNLLDRFLLMVLYLSWDGDSWSEDHEWLTTGTVCSWEGVYCNYNETVDELYFTDLSPQGNIPSLIGKLDGIHTLIISGDQVGGTIPSEIGALTALTKLGIYEAGLTGTIPSTMGLLTNLVSLDLYGNSLTGIIPSTLLQLESLKYIDIRGNNVTGDLLLAPLQWPSYVDVTGGEVEDTSIEEKAVYAAPSSGSSPP